jgi:hypothetical protein
VRIAANSLKMLRVFYHKISRTEALSIAIID